MIAEYSPIEHRHRFAAWAGARAAQRGFTKVDILQAALEKSGVRKVVENQLSWPSTHDSFDIKHQEWCTVVCKHLETAGIREPTYGRAAKLIGVYLKVMVVIPRPDSQLATVAHPPIDRRLLQNLAKSDNFNFSPEHRREWRRTSWTKLTQDEYCTLIRQFRHYGLDKPQFWYLERHWTAA